MTPFHVGLVKLPDAMMVCLFNGDDKLRTLSFQLPKSNMNKDYWSGEELGRHDGVLKIKDMAPHAARLLSCA
jgi:hypothetical protein